MSYMTIDVGMKHLAYCIISNTGGIYGFEMISVNAKDKVKFICDILTERIHTYNIIKVIVEQQVLKNVQAMIIQNIIKTYCYINNIEFSTYNPKNKFKYLNETYNSKKKEHKKISIRYAINILTRMNRSDLISMFNQYDKKDDLADAICMAVMSVYPDDKVISLICK